MEPLLSVKELQTRFATKKGFVTAVDGVSFEVNKGEILCIVGESGCGKSTIAMSILRLLSGNGENSHGEVLFGDRDLLKLTEDDMCSVRGNDIAMIFQDPMSSLNPTLTIGHQLEEPFRIHRGMNKKQAREAALEMLRKVSIPSPEKRLNEYPHQLSGGMRQRVMIAMALSCEPKLLIADEPTTALDVTIQAQILDLMRKLRDETGAAIVFITHDLGVVAEMADRVLVLYAGKSVEYGTVDQIFNHPKHPYTKGLLKSIPRLDQNEDYLFAIEGVVPNQYNMPAGCRYCPRCPDAMPQCEKNQPPEFAVDGSYVSCFQYAGGVSHEK